MIKKCKIKIFVLSILVLTILFSGCLDVPHDKKWGIYSLDLASEKIGLIYSSTDKISNLGLNSIDNKFVFSQQINGQNNENEEICTLNIVGDNLQRLTNNSYWDIYPVWSSDGKNIAFLSLRDTDLDIYVMDSNGDNSHLLFDSGSHDADINWVGNTIVFTSKSCIWKIDDDGKNPIQITNPPRAGEWGNANLPFGDYDPRISPDGNKIVFERLENDTSIHGNYNFFIIDIDGSNEIRLTDNYYSQGIASWSNSGDKLVYTVAAINDVGKYDLYMMNSDGSDNHDVTPKYFPDDFLCHSPTFSKDDSKIYFIGEWWE